MLRFSPSKRIYTTFGDFLLFLYFILSPYSKTVGYISKFSFKYKKIIKSYYYRKIGRNMFIRDINFLNYYTLMIKFLQKMYYIVFIFLY